MASRTNVVVRAPNYEEAAETLPLTVVLWRARLAVSSCFRANLRAFGLTEQQWRVLRRLSRVRHENITLMAVQTDILPPSLSRILRDLANRKLVVRTVSESLDRRQVLASLTAAGKRLVAEVDADLRPITIALEKHLGQKKLDFLKATLGELVAWTETREA